MMPLILSACLWAAQFVQTLSDLVHATHPLPPQIFISQQLRILLGTYCILDVTEHLFCTR